MIWIVITIVLILGWLAIGGWSFIFWWTREWDFTSKDIPVLLIAMFFGPFTFPIGWIIHGPFAFPMGENKKTVLRKRK